MPIHVRYRAVVQGGRLYHPIDAIGRLVCSNRIAGWKLGLVAADLVRKFDEAHRASEPRFRCLLGVKTDDIPKADLDARLDVGTVELTEPEYALLRDLVEHASDAECFTMGFEKDRIVGLDMVVYAPILRDFVDPVGAAKAPPEVPDDPEWAQLARAKRAEWDKLVADTARPS